VQPGARHFQYVEDFVVMGCRAHQQASEVGVPRHGELKQELLVVRRVHPEMLEETPRSRHLP
jgi:hypothetical protein